MKVPSVKGTRDFYPEDMAVRNWIFDTWRAVSQRAGFQEYDGPIFENLQLYTDKSGEEIVGQLYTMEDYGGRRLAIRPEMTPTLARMVAARQQSLPQPIKWFSIDRLCRYERPQKGRLREFFQWNIDIIGVKEVTADAESVNVALDSLLALGLRADDIEARVNSRSLLAALLTGIGVPEDKLAKVYTVADKRGKVPDEVLEAMFDDLGLEAGVLADLQAIMRVEDLEAIGRLIADRGLAGAEAPYAELREMFDLLDAFGKADLCRFDIGIVRGLAYYTGPVFEVFDRKGELRALCGGGRYDNLLGAMGGQQTPAVGFGLGDVVLAELLRERGLLPEAGDRVDYMVVAAGQDMLLPVIRVVQGLRAKGVSAEFSLKAQNLGKLLRRAGSMGVRRVVIVGQDEWADGRQVQVRDMAAGEQKAMPVEELLGGPLP